MSRFSDFITKLIVGLPWGEVYPGRAAPPPPALDGRTASLRVLARYISELTFFRENARGSDLIPFQIPLDRIHIEWPDNVEEITRQLPVIALISGGDIEHKSLGMGSWLDEATRDVYGRNTALQVQSDNVEPIHIEVLCSTKQERAAIREGLTSALSPTEFMAGIRFKVPDYYSQVVTFMLQRTTITEGDDSAKNRRAMRMVVEMNYIDVALVNVLPLSPIMTTYVDTVDGASPFALDDEIPDRVAVEGALDVASPPFVDSSAPIARVYPAANPDRVVDAILTGEGELLLTSDDQEIEIGV